mmetsp:Transcript_3846/g.11456  ORF Transcript_3846/g.11456 Transcript_3846/m.11456 type:complete len:668 (+) Transcript_3846:95-2098(+)
MGRGEGFRALLKANAPVVFDGAMGSALYEQGWLHTRAFEEANLQAPDKVRAVHDGYVAAGAQVIETNTFAGNALALQRVGAVASVEEINRAAVKIARAAASAAPSDVFVAGAVGPTGETANFIDEDLEATLREAFTEQIKAITLAEDGVDLLILETFSFLAEIKIALEVARSLFEGPIIACMSVSAEVADNTYSQGRIARLLSKWGADVVGVNCGGGGWGRLGEGGAAAVYDAAEQMVREKAAPVLAMPNAGHPKRVGGREIYMATSEYFLVYAKRLFKAGVMLVGGCCGTNPTHIESVVNASKMFGGGAVGVQVPVKGAPGNEAEKWEDVRVEPIPVHRRSKLAAKVSQVYEERLQGGKRRMKPTGPSDFVVSVEVNPSPGLSMEKPLAAAKMLREAGVDVINIADGPRASVRMNNSTLGQAVRSELGLECILHVCCRDRNLLGLLSDALGNHSREMHNLVVITGDPPKLGNFPKAAGVFDLDSIGLLRVLSDLNAGVDPAGGSIKGQTSFFLATGAEPGAVDYEREMRRLREKIDAGAEMVMTQPVYDPAVVKRFLDDVESFPKPVPVLVGLCPLVSSRNAEFLHNEVPGMSVPEDIRARMREAGSGPAARQVGVDIAKQMLNEVSDRVVGVYIMPQVGRYELAVDVLHDLGYGPQPQELNGTAT